MSRAGKRPNGYKKSHYDIKTHLICATKNCTCPCDACEFRRKRVEAGEIGGSKDGPRG